MSEAVKKACEGHWLNFTELSSPVKYPSGFSVLGSKVNLRAISIYVRLIDLLDVTADRTPYVLWKFVSPKNKFSKMEWAKHRSLTSVSSDSYNQGRIIKIDGSTDDHEVYYSLKDLQFWCDEQFRGCIDLLSDMNDKVHRLDLYHIYWNIEANGFNPVSIKFQFNRDRMFQILGDQIYNNDPYVFLRELLQNSIDAIRVRKEIFQNKKMSFEGKIEVQVDYFDNGNATVIWKDNGIGMNEYIIKNYLSVAGKSYYSSPDFERLGLTMDPISKFGIGVLSCYAVADYIEITTFRDPYLDRNSKCLKISIPNFNSYFRVETIDDSDVEPGTTFKIIINSEKNLDENNENRVKDITEYLMNIAGFVEFPIFITEKSRKTAIISPNLDKKDFVRLYGNELEIQQLDLNYSNKVIFAQDHKSYYQLMSEVTFFLDKDIGLVNMEGSISFFIPRDFSQEFFHDQSTLRGDFVKIKSKEKQVRISDESNKVLSPSCIKSNFCNVYNDGILVSNTKKYLFQEINTFSTPKIEVNIKKNTVSNNISIDRTTLNSDSWSQKIIENYFRYIINNNIEEIINEPINTRLTKIGQVIGFYNVDPKFFLDVFPKEHFVIPFLKQSGEVEFICLNNVLKNNIYMLYDDIPDYSAIQIDDLTYKGIYEYWKGHPLPICSYNYSDEFVVYIISKLINAAINKYYYLSELTFLSSPSDDVVHLTLGTYLPNNSSNDIDVNELNDKVENSDYEVSDYEVYVFNKLKLGSSEIELRMRFTRFSEKFNNYIICGVSFYNFNHPKIRKLLSIFIIINKKIKNEIVSKEKIGTLNDVLSGLEYTSNADRIIFKWKQLLLLLKKDWYFDFNIDDMLITENEIYFDSFDDYKGKISFSDFISEFESDYTEINCFGKEIIR